MGSDTRRAVEAILMVADRPIDPHLLAQVTETSPAEIDELLRALAAEYEQQGRGFVLAHVAGGWRYQTHPDLAPYVERFVLEGQTARLSAAALETLAIVAYKQPISRAQIAAIRGVNVDGVVRTLEQRGYIAEVARDPGPGQPVLFGTTDLFLEKLGLASLDELPPIADFVPGPDVVEALEAGLRADIATGESERRDRQADIAAAEGELASAPPSTDPSRDDEIRGGQAHVEQTHVDEARADRSADGQTRDGLEPA
ncbi:MAG: SMC-Scp complex subunit ScpB [Acidimicrobiales bacterium]